MCIERSRLKEEEDEGEVDREWREGERAVVRESGERDKSAAAMDERMSASRREGKTGTSEADLPKASLYWYDAESTSYLSTEADNRRATEPLRYRHALWNLPVSTSFLCMQLAPKA